MELEIIVGLHKDFSTNIDKTLTNKPWAIS